MRKHPFLIGQYYHIYNRGTDKRIIFKDSGDLKRFFKCMNEFNVVAPIGHIRDISDKLDKKNKLVDIVCYCLNPNHYHFILTPLVENGIEKFIQKIGGGFTRYFNEKHKRTGVLFQGKFKSVLIDSDKYLMYLSAYVNLNNCVHKLSVSSIRLRGKNINLFWKSSWKEYIGENKERFCNKSIVLDRYKNIKDYEEFAKSVVAGVLNKRYQNDLFLDKNLLIEE